MKTILSTTLALATWITAHADAPPPSNTPIVKPNSAAAEPADDFGEDVREVDITKRVVDQALATADRATKHARRIMEFAPGRIAFADGDFAEPVELQAAVEDGFGFAVAGSGRSGSQPLIIRGSDVDSNAVANIQEDLSVMSRILNKAIEREVGRDGRDSAMGIVLSALPGSRRPQSIYLEGYGALFLVSVKFPLVPPPAKEEEKSEKSADSTWEQTKREMYGSRMPNVRVWNVPTGDAAEYDSEQVDSLKKELITSMKNAANIRDVKPNEWITVTVIGSRGGGANRVKHVSGQKGKVARSEIYVADVRPAARESTLTLRAKKSDVDAFAKGDIDIEQFTKRVLVAAY